MGLRKVPPEPKKILPITVGIDNYKYWTPLQNAVNDADAIKNLLCGEFNVLTLDEFHIRNNQATASQLRLLFNDLLTPKIKELGEDVGVFAFFSCHGMVENGRGFLIPVDAGINPPLKNCIDIKKDIIDVCKAKAFPARAVFLAFATCYSGIALKDTWSEHDENVHPVQILAAGKMAQSIPDSHQNQRNSLFTLALLDGLRGKAEVGLQGDAISGSELIGFVRAKVYSKSRQLGLPQDPQGGYAQTNSSGDEFVFIPNRPRFSSEALNYSEGIADIRKSKIKLIIEEAENKNIIDQAMVIISDIVETDDDLDVRLEGLDYLRLLIWRHPTDTAPAVTELLNVAKKYLSLRKHILLDLGKRSVSNLYKGLPIEELIWELKSNEQNNDLVILGKKYSDDKDTSLKAMELLGNVAPLLHFDKSKQNATLKLILNVLKWNYTNSYQHIASAIISWLSYADEMNEENPEVEKAPEKWTIKARKEAKAYWTTVRREKRLLLAMIDSVQQNPNAMLLFDSQDGSPSPFQSLMQNTDRKSVTRVFQHFETALSTSVDIEKKGRLIEIASQINRRRGSSLLKKILQNKRLPTDLRMKALYSIGHEYFDYDFDYDLSIPKRVAPIIEIIKNSAKDDIDLEFRKACKYFLGDIAAKQTPYPRWSENSQQKDNFFTT